MEPKCSQSQHTFTCNVFVCFVLFSLRILEPLIFAMNYSVLAMCYGFLGSQHRRKHVEINVEINSKNGSHFWKLENCALLPESFGWGFVLELIPVRAPLTVLPDSLVLPCLSRGSAVPLSLTSLSSPHTELGE